MKKEMGQGATYVFVDLERVTEGEGGEGEE